MAPSFPTASSGGLFTPLQTQFMTNPPAMLLALACCLAPASAAVYHLDSLTGADSASGLSPALAWRSLEKANATELKPGDQLLFKAGGRWSGRFTPQGGGDSKARVLIGRYGDGALPRIDGEGKFPDTVQLKNISFVEMADLEITNRGPKSAPWRTGVSVLADGVGKMQRIYLQRLFVHDVNGDLRKTHEGCGIFFEAKGDHPSHFDGLLIEKCRIERTDRNGICQRGNGQVRSVNVIIRDNILEDIGGDGIKLWGTNGGIIERNVVRKARARCADSAAGIWPFACDDTLIQFNEVSGTKGNQDGQGFDADYYCRRSVIQYNYSHDNEGGFILVCGPGKSFNESPVVRYNISVHDGIKSARVFHFGGKSTNALVHNNTIVIGADQDLPMILQTKWEGGVCENARFANNLFMVEAGGRATYDFTHGKRNVFDSNLFCGRQVGLPAGTTLSTAPQLAASVKPAPGLDSLQGCRPADAATFPRGIIINDNGGRDFFGNPLPTDRPPAIGACEK